MLYVIECKKYNLIVMFQKDFIFDNDDEVKIINTCCKMNRRSVLEKDKYIVICYNDNMIKLKNTKSGKIEYRQRISIKILN